MKKLFGLLALVALLNEACHRPYALYQRSSQYSVTYPTPGRPSQVAEAIDAEKLAGVSATEQAITDTVAVALALASTRPLTTDQAQRMAHRMQRATQLVSQKSETNEALDWPQPRPKPKTQLRLGNRIRQGLGIPLRKELNWWQRIPWQLKAAVPVIIVAVVFAILHITLLGVIFGLLGAFLLIRGLKKSFKVRRPWF